MKEKLAVGVDVGGTKIAFVLIDSHGKIQAEYQLSTLPQEGVEAVLDRITQGIDYLLPQADDDIAGVGIGCPGYIEIDKGVVRNAVNLYWTDVPLVDEITQRLNQRFPIWLQKDANAAALGEMYFGAARGCQDFIYVAIGTGLGGSAIVNGEILMGANEYAMEIGHMPLNPQGRLCNCGLHGCAEIYVSKMGLLAGVHEYLSQYPESVLAKVDDDLNTQHIMDAARANDPLATRVMQEAGEWLCLVLTAGAAMFNPAMVVIAGGLGHAAADFLIEHARRELPHRTPYFTHQHLQIVESQISNSAIGAACLVWHEANKRQS